MGIPDLSEGFSPENIDRIYHGQAALVDGEEPGDVLTPEEFEVLSHVADGLPNGEVAVEMYISPSTASRLVKSGFERLGVLEKFQLAGYFPLGPEHELVKDKKFADFGERNRRLDTLQGLTVGLDYGRIAADQGLTVPSVETHVSKSTGTWANIRWPLMVTMAVNAMRAKYVRAVEADPEAMEQDLLGDSTLPELKEAEPEILRLIKAQKKAAAEARA